MTERRESDWTLYRRALRFAAPYRFHVAAVAGVGLLATPIALLVPVPLKIVVDNVLGGDPVAGPIGWFVPPLARGGATPLLLWAVFLVVTIAIVQELQKLASTLLRTWVGERLLLDFRARLFHHSQRLSLLYHDRAGTSDALYRIQYDAYAIQTLAIDGVIPFFTSTVTLVGMIYVVARIDLQLALVALAISPFLFLLTTLYRRRLRPQWKRVKKLESSGLSVVQEVMTGLRVVKSFGQEEREQRRFESRYREGFLARMRVMVGESGFSLLLGLTTAIGTALILWIGVGHVLAGTLTLGSLLLVVGYLGQLYEPLRTMGKQTTKLQNALASAERAFDLLDHEPEVEERPCAVSLRRAEGRVAFEGLSFTYDRVLVLRNVSFSVPAGTRVGIAGPTGAGKTTLVSLLTRFYDPDEGRILLDGRDVRDYRVADLRDQFAIVLQETLLFSTTVAENIAYARPDASLDQIRDAAAAANIDDFVSSLPDGYETLVGERGMRLSGGERQRIALARAFLKDAPILILDEPTSSVDIETEAAIIDAMERLMEGRTTFMIAHRLSTLEGCDLLVVLDRGEVQTVTDRPDEMVRTARAAGTLRIPPMEPGRAR